VLERFPAARAANLREIDHAARLAREYPGTIAAMAAGNETQVFWSGNRLPAERLIAYLRELRARTRVPVTTADDYNFWNKPESRAVAAECDFVCVHLHPLWNGTSPEGALPWIETQLASIRALHPDREVVIGETGWATRRNDEGDQGRLMKGAVGEAEQAAFVRALRAWLAASHVPTFTFEAFDENWKGGPDPNDVEKHWGLYRADRTPKPAAEGGS
jgi:exo-beta-1,3-glucanase (GH17 family)